MPGALDRDRKNTHRFGCWKTVLKHKRFFRHCVLVLISLVPYAGAPGRIRFPCLDWARGNTFAVW